MKITTKRQFYALWQAGVLGNRTRLWNDPREAYSAGLLQYGFREVRRAGTAGAGKWELVSRHNFWWKVTEWASEGRQLMIDDACPNEETTLCGEVCRTYLGLTGHLAIQPRCSMREAINRGLLQHRSPTVTRALLEHFMDDSSRDDLDQLLELYPDAAVEFSCFPRHVGAFPNRNTLFWETRDY